MEILDFLLRWLHLLFGIAWIGLLYYFNFIQSAYSKQASAEALADVKAKLVPRGLWWFRWAAMFTFISGGLLAVGVYKQNLFNDYIVVGGLLGTLMFLNVWFIIWPKQKIALDLAPGDKAAAATSALLASRTNTLFSAPMVYCMLASPHQGYQVDYLLVGDGGDRGLWIVILLIGLIELNAIVGKQGPMASITGVIVSSLLLTGIVVGTLVVF